MVPDPPGNRTPAVGLEGRDSIDHASATDNFPFNIERKKFYPGPGIELGSPALRAGALITELSSTNNNP